MELQASSSVTFRVLGSVEALQEGQPVALGGPRQRHLLALLLLEPGRPVSASRLIDELWADEPPDGAEVTLRSYVSRLRTALGEAVPIAAGTGGYAIDATDDSIDARRFERLIREGEAVGGAGRFRRSRDRIVAALDLWTGSPFGELATDGALRIEAERLAELRLHALELRIEADLQLGATAELVDELERLVREHPYREALWRQLMLALYRSERQADALAAYHRARATLDEQLGLEPGPELEALQAAILRQDVPPPATASGSARSRLPTPVSSFVGRTAELAEVIRLLGETRLVTLSGVGGVGKTRLAIEAARGRLPDHEDGVVFVDLAPLADPGLVAPHVANVLDLREQAGVSSVELLANTLRSADMLLVLDNCEHLRDACAELANRLLSTCPDLRVLATSREVLGVPGEVDFAVPPLALPAEAAASVLRDSEAVRLFLARAREARPGMPDDDQSIETIARICSDLDGLPLGIELAAARARALSFAEIAARLDDRFRFLVSWRRLSTARHRTLREAMDWSYGLLAPDEQRVLRGLSVFAGGFTLDAVAAVCADGDEDRALGHLERLVEASLVTVDARQDPTRYGLLETVRQYGAEQLSSEGETDALRARHAAHYTASAAAAWELRRVHSLDVEWAEQIGRERENIRASLTWHQQLGDGASMLRLAEAVWRFWWVKGELTEGRTWLSAALDLAAGSDPLLRARAHLGLGGLAWAHGDFETGEVHASAAVALFKELGNAHYEGGALNTLGVIAHGKREHVRARTVFEASIERLRAADRESTDETVAAGVRRSIAITIDNLGSIEHEIGNDLAALARYREALAMNRERNDRHGVAMNELHIAIIEAETGRLDEARTLLSRSLQVYRAVGFRQYAAECLETASIVANGLGSPRDAAFFLGAASRLRDDAGAPPVPFMARLRERESEAARIELGAATFDELFDAARRTPSDTALERAMHILGTAGEA